ncbi:MAG: YbbR-like domain-containing protein [Bacteroidetes bacterium]|nr:YbbR-like domain-containing protein [Bacteroidota bacterium]
MSQSDSIYSNNKKKPAKTTAFFICLLVAGFLWLIKSLNTIYYHQLKIPVTFKNIPQNKKPLQEIPSNLYVDIKASGLKLFFILLNQPFKTVEIDFNDLKTTNKQRNYILSPSTIAFKNTLKFETTIKQISPDTIYFIENSGYQKNVPVKVPLYVKCVPGYGFGTPDINPAFVTIIGDSNSIKRIDTIYTQALYLNNLSERAEKKIAIIKPDENVYYNINEINVRVEVDRLIEQTASLPINIISFNLSYKSINIYPSRVKVKFTALQNSFSPSDTALFRASVNSANFNSSNKTPVFLTTQPGNVNIISIEPREAEILIIKK